MTKKEIFVMGRAEYLSDTMGISLTEGTKIAEKELREEETNNVRCDKNGINIRTVL